MQLIGVPPSATSMCSLYSVQDCMYPFALRLTSNVHYFGNYSNISYLRIVC